MGKNIQISSYEYVKYYQKRATFLSHISIINITNIIKGGKKKI
jgi:hypothetical protein